MRMEERLVRRKEEDIIEIGEVMKKFYNSQAGVVFRSFVNAIIMDNVSQVHDSLISADRKLGRAEGANMVRDFVEMAIQDMEKLTEPLPEEEKDGQ